MRGRAEITALYLKMFDSGRGVEIGFKVVDELVGSDYALFVGRETGSYLVREGSRVPLAIRTTRFFRHADGVWRQYHHHGSIDDPNALARYQEAVRG